MKLKVKRANKNSAHVRLKQVLKKKTKNER